MKFRIGDLVRLNREGFQGVRPSTPEESRAALEGSRIVDMEQVTPDGLFAIDLDGPLSMYLINSDWIEHVNSPAQGQAVQYERWGTAGGREGIQRTLSPDDAADAEFAAHGIRTVDAHGNERALTVEELNRMGVRRCVAAKDVRTGELKWREEGPKTPFFVVPTAGTW